MPDTYQVCSVLVAWSCPSLCDCSSQNSPVHAILQARILEWAAIPFSRGCSQPRDGTQVSCSADKFFTIWATREAHTYQVQYKLLNIWKHISCEILSMHLYFYQWNKNFICASQIFFCLHLFSLDYLFQSLCQFF